MVAITVYSEHPPSPCSHQSRQLFPPTHLFVRFLEGSTVLLKYQTPSTEFGTEGMLNKYILGEGERHYRLHVDYIIITIMIVFKYFIQSLNKNLLQQFVQQEIPVQVRFPRKQNLS